MSHFDEKTSKYLDDAIGSWNPAADYVGWDDEEERIEDENGQVIDVIRKHNSKWEVKI